MALQGKGFFIWKISDVENGNATATATAAREADLSHVLVKVADGNHFYNVDPNTNIDRAPYLVEVLRNNQIQVYGWHYVYGYDPVGEADAAIRRIQQLHLDGYVIDAEAEYKQPGKATAARQFMSRLRSALPHFPLVLSSYRYPSLHPQFPWSEFLEKCDLNMPQVYWLQSHNPGEQLIRCLREFQTITPFRPIIPTGAAFVERGWSPSPGEVTEFLKTARSLNLTAANFWEWANCRRNLPEVWEAIKNYSWGGQVPTGGDIAQRLIETMNSHDPNQVVALYTSSAVHVTSKRTVQGTAVIRSWYTSLFTQLLPNAVFTLTSFSGTGSSRHLTWTATSPGGSVHNGSDTLGLIGDKISYHYTSFTVS